MNSLSFPALIAIVLALLLVFVYLMVYNPILAFSIIGAAGYTLVFAVVCWRLYQTGFDLFSPVAIFGSFLLLTYPIKGMYILSTSAYGPFVTQNYRFLLDARHMLYFSEALALSAFCSLIFLWLINLHWLKQPAYKPLLSGRVWNLQRMSLVMAVISLALAVLFSWLISVSGGLGLYLQSVAGRQSFFYGRYFIYVLIDLFPEVSCFYLACQIERRNRYPFIFLPVLLIAISSANILVSVLAGNRSTFLIGFAIPMLAYWHYRVKPIKLVQAVLAVVLVLFVSIFYISTFRGGNIAERLTLETVQQNIGASINNISSLIFGGPDLVQLDTLMVTMQEIPVNHPYFAGESIKAILAFPVPRALYPDKPVRGNWLFTDAIFPSWRVNLSGFTVSYLGDWYMNFGIAGAVAGTILLGFVLRALLVRISPKASWANAVFYGLVLSNTLTIFRSDTFSLINFGISVFFAIAIILFCSSKQYSPD